jgi:hypothetical protein
VLRQKTVANFPVVLLFGLALATVGSRAQRQGTPSAKGAEAPEAISISHRARQAAALGLKEVKLTMDSGIPMQVSSLSQALETHGLVVAHLLGEQTMLWRDRQVLTWYKFRVSRKIHDGPRPTSRALPIVGLAGYPADLLPHDLLPLEAGDFLILRGNGTVTMDGVTITAALADEPAFEQSKSYLLFLVTDERSEVAVLPMNADGLFQVSDRGDIQSMGDPTHPVVHDIREIHHNRLKSLDQSLTLRPAE